MYQFVKTIVNRFLWLQIADNNTAKKAVYIGSIVHVLAFLCLSAFVMYNISNDMDYVMKVISSSFSDTCNADVDCVKKELLISFVAVIFLTFLIYCGSIYSSLIVVGGYLIMLLEVYVEVFVSGEFAADSLIVITLVVIVIVNVFRGNYYLSRNKPARKIW